MLLISLILSTSFAGEFEDITNGKWNSTPNIQICDDAKVKVSIVKKAASYWKKKGLSRGGERRLGGAITGQARYGGSMGPQGIL